MEIKVVFTNGSIRNIKTNCWEFAGDNLERIDYRIPSPATITGFEARSILLNDKVSKVIIDEDIVYII